MATIYRLDDSTLYMCESCLNSHGPVPGIWRATPYDTCSVCGEIDLLTREETDEYHNYMNGLQWEDDQRMWEDHIAPEIYNPQELK